MPLVQVPLSSKTVGTLAAGAFARIGGGVASPSLRTDVPGLGAVLTSPLDTLKVRLQFSQNSPGVKHYSGVRDAFVSIMKNEGIAVITALNRCSSRTACLLQWITGHT